MGPLAGFKIIELAGLGPGPFCGMMLADMGAEVISVERTSENPNNKPLDCDKRGKRSVAINLKTPQGIETLLQLVEKADALFEGFRPGVMERLGIGPDQCMARNPKLVYGRMTGWGQYGPLSKAAGHDINYIALTGVLFGVGRSHEKPVPPLNLVGDFGGGAMFLAFGLVCALLETQRSGKGQIIDAAMTDGSALLMSMMHSLHAQGIVNTNRGMNIIDSGAHFYEVYETLDNKYISIGSIEPQFYQLLIEKSGLNVEIFADHMNPVRWPELKQKLDVVFKTKTSADWCQLMEATDVCFAPVLDFIEAHDHPHNIARETYVDVEGMTQPAPAPRFSRTPPEISHAARARGIDTKEVLSDWGFNKDEIKILEEKGTFS